MMIFSYACVDLSGKGDQVVSGLTACHRVVVQTRRITKATASNQTNHRGMHVTPEEVGGLGQQHALSMFHGSLNGCTCLKNRFDLVASIVSPFNMSSPYRISILLVTRVHRTQIAGRMNRRSMCEWPKAHALYHRHRQRQNSP